MVLVLALASGLVTSVVTTSYVQTRQPVFFRLLLINILLFNLLILSGLVFQYLQLMLQAAELNSYRNALPVLLILMAVLKMAWLHVFITMMRSLITEVQAHKMPVLLAWSGVVLLLVFSILLVTAWLGQLSGLLHTTISTFEGIIVGGALLSTLWLIKKAAGIPAGQRRLSIRVFGFYHLCLMGIVLLTLLLGWLNSGLSGSHQLMANGIFLTLYNLFPLIWLKWFRPLPVSSGDEKFDLFGITQREKEIIRLIQDGKTNQEIADALFISIATVKDHNHNIFKKCGIRNRLELAKLFQQAQ